MRAADVMNPGLAIGAVVLLAGGLVPPPLARAAGRSVLDLNLTADETVLERWVRLLDEGGQGALPIRAVHGPQVPAPTVPEGLRGRVRVLRETDAYRGPAGAVRDAIMDLDPERFALVIEATRYHEGPLGPILRDARVGRADVVLACNADRSPAGVYLIRKRVFDHVPAVGYMDLKEQLIARVSQEGDRVAVVEHGDVVSFPIRTRRELLRAASLAASDGAGVVGGIRAGVLTAERWASAVSARARVSPLAVVVESIVMGGAEVGERAVVARSVIGPGARVEDGRVVIDEVVVGQAAAPDVPARSGGRMRRLIRLSSSGVPGLARARGQQGR